MIFGDHTLETKLCLAPPLAFFNFINEVDSVMNATKKCESLIIWILRPVENSKYWKDALRHLIEHQQKNWEAQTVVRAKMNLYEQDEQDVEKDLRNEL